ncbi:MAG: hypothetical protein KKF46_08045 [Nanoarchaeota archaeon]|nr:hypothetical protein [Nanoarchaeota archaeon]MBU1322279.1 hypothetical protein [Nanoarchaeota archaeon]MBU1598032.1 hypothetical protein [Nanoarchaeota archaeon]MBU2441002.1 hypothetical protein [Nanoarchaeota archaeon]
MYFKENSPNYELEEARAFLKNILKNYALKIYESGVINDKVQTTGLNYSFSCKFLLVNAKKK